MLLDRMVNLLSRGCVVPVVKYIKQCWLRGDTDISLIRYFVTEVSAYWAVGEVYLHFPQLERIWSYSQDVNPGPLKYEAGADTGC